MKRIILIFWIWIMVFPIATIFAVEGNINHFSGITASVPLNANVLPYASVKWRSDNGVLRFSGSPNQTITGIVIAFVESNCEINSLITGSPFTDGTYTLDFQWRHPYNSRWYWIGRECIPFVNWPMGVTKIPVLFKVTTGPQISSQAAGDYSGSLTFTVYQSF